MGFRTHTGWAVVVVVAGIESPQVVDRRRITLTGPSLPFEPYHAAKSLTPTGAETLIERAAEVANARAAGAIGVISASVVAKGYQLVAGAVALSSGRPDFTLSQALSSHAATHNAEGWLYRHAVLQAGQSCDLQMVGVPERDVYAEAAAAMGTTVPTLQERINEGRPSGAPWGQDQKAAAAAALFALALHSA